MFEPKEVLAGDEVGVASQKRIRTTSSDSTLEFLSVLHPLQSINPHVRIPSVPFPDSGKAETLSRRGPQLHAEDVPQVLLPVGVLVPEDTQADALRGQTQNADGLVVGRLPQVDTVHLEGRKRDGCEELPRRMGKFCAINAGCA